MLSYKCARFSKVLKYHINAFPVTFFFDKSNKNGIETYFDYQRDMYECIVVYKNASMNEIKLWVPLKCRFYPYMMSILHKF